MQDRAIRLAARARRAADRALAAAGERSAKRLTPFFPYTLRLDHPPTADLRPRYGSGRPVHAGIDAIFRSGHSRYREHLEGVGAYTEDLARIPRKGELGLEPCWINPWLIGLDTATLYSFTRTRRPSLYVEVGSGQSTKVVHRARRDGEVDLEILSIDPSPRSEVDRLCDLKVRSPLETADLDACFGRLRSGDIVFFDGSHRVLPNSDCVAFFLDVLPSLPPGVLVGIHDVFLPEDYPADFIGFWWSEQYLLAALLLAEPEWLTVELPTYFVSGVADLAALVDPLFSRPELVDVDRRGSVCWFETLSGPPAG